MSDNIGQIAEGVQCREDFVRFVTALRQNLAQDRERWENDSLERFLEAMAGWTSDMDGYFRNRGETVPEVPDWKLMARILLAARVYE